eukprot:8114391-Pyramimonas_sp.AAC.1
MALCRGLNAVVVWSVNDIDCVDYNLKWLDVRRHADRVPNKTGRHNDNYIKCESDVPVHMPTRVKVDASRFIGVMQYF